MEGEYSKEVQRFRALLNETTSIMALFADEEAFQTIHGFRIEDYLRERDQCSDRLRDLGCHIKKVVYDTGIAKTTGGSAGILGGIMAGLGVIAAPFTFGLSLGLTVGGAALGIGGAATVITANIIKDTHMKNKENDIKDLMARLKPKDDVIHNLMTQLKEKSSEMRELQGISDVQNFLKIAVTGKGIVVNVLYNGVKLFKTAQAIPFCIEVAKFVQYDYQVTKLVATGLAAQEINIFGKVFVTAASTTAKVLTGALAVLGIVFGIFDVVDGARNIRGSQDADDIFDSRQRLDAITREYDDFINKIRVAAGLSPYNRRHLCILVNKNSGKVIDFPTQGGDTLQQWNFNDYPSHKLWVSSGKNQVTFQCQRTDQYMVARSNDYYLHIQNASTFQKIMPALMKSGCIVNQGNQWQISLSPEQKFTIVSSNPDDPRQCHILTNSGKALDVWGCSQHCGAKIEQWPKYQTESQKWLLLRL